MSDYECTFDRYQERRRTGIKTKLMHTIRNHDARRFHLSTLLLMALLLKSDSAAAFRVVGQSKIATKTPSRNSRVDHAPYYRTRSRCQTRRWFHDDADNADNNDDEESWFETLTRFSKTATEDSNNNINKKKISEERNLDTTSEIIVPSSAKRRHSFETDRLLSDSPQVMDDLRQSFRNVETETNFLLQKKPALAFAIFVAAGLIVAYMSGFFFLGGYIDSSNPYENGAVPYFEEEVLETVTEGENVPSSLLSAPSD